MSARVVRLKVEGGEELGRWLRGIGAHLGTQVLEQAVTDGADIIKDESNRLAPSPGIETQTILRSPRKVEVAIGPEKSKWYLMFLETGAQAHEIRPVDRKALELAPGEVFVSYLTGENKHPGIVARPFLRPAVDIKGEAAVKRIGERLGAAMERYKAAK